MPRSAEALPSVPRFVAVAPAPNGRRARRRNNPHLEARAPPLCTPHTWGRRAQHSPLKLALSCAPPPTRPLVVVHLSPRLQAGALEAPTQVSQVRREHGMHASIVCPSWSSTTRRHLKQRQLGSSDGGAWRGGLVGVAICSPAPLSPSGNLASSSRARLTLGPARRAVEARSRTLGPARRAVGSPLPRPDSDGAPHAQHSPPCASKLALSCAPPQARRSCGLRSTPSGNFAEGWLTLLPSPATSPRRRATRSRSLAPVIYQVRSFVPP